MPSIKLTIQKRTQDPWILNFNNFLSTEYFTEQEITDVIRPYWQNVQQINGLIDTVVENVDGDTRTVTYKFDTMQSMIDSRYHMVESDLAKNRVQIIQNAIARNNIQPYIIQTEIIHEELVNP